MCVCVCVELVSSLRVMHAVVPPVIYSTWIVFVRRCALRTRQVSVTHHPELPPPAVRAQEKAVLLTPEPSRRLP